MSLRITFSRTVVTRRLYRLTRTVRAFIGKPRAKIGDCLATLQGHPGLPTIGSCSSDSRTVLLARFSPDLSPSSPPGTLSDDRKILDCPEMGFLGCNAKFSPKPGGQGRLSAPRVDLAVGAVLCSIGRRGDDRYRLPECGHERSSHFRRKITAGSPIEPTKQEQ